MRHNKVSTSSLLSLYNESHQTYKCNLLRGLYLAVKRCIGVYGPLLLCLYVLIPLHPIIIYEK
jgi:hypothetical protein